ncbi:MAG: hypothetical protein RL311_144 [Bacteroidota bacterium]|jgi:hypothetical protein
MAKIEEYNINPAPQIIITTESVLNEFKGGKELFEQSAMFQKVVNLIVKGLSWQQAMEKFVKISIQQEIIISTLVEKLPPDLSFKK